MAPRYVLGCLLVVAILGMVDGRSFFRRRGISRKYNGFMKLMTEAFKKPEVEMMGAIFKRHVQQLRHIPNKQVELVFLIDSSATVGRRYFYEEVGYVLNSFVLQFMTLLYLSKTAYHRDHYECYLKKQTITTIFQII